MLVVSMVFLNLFIAIILEGFSSTSEQEEQTVSEPQIEQFRRLWSEYDPDATGLIEVFELKDLIDDLREDETGLLKYGKFLDSDKQIDLFIAELEIPTYNNFRNYHFLDVLNSIARYNVSLKHQMESEEAVAT